MSNSNYNCEKCGRNFPQKSGLDAHKAKKKPCKPFVKREDISIASITPEQRERKLQRQRERVEMEYRHANDEKCDTGGSLTYSNQQEAAAEITKHFLSGKLAVALLAQPGAGKTGVALEVIRHMLTNSSFSILDTEVSIVSGMNDLEWKNQFADKMLPSFSKNVFHRGTLAANHDHLDNSKLVVEDECHVAAGKDMTMSREFKKAGLLDIENLKTNGRKILQVSATPEATEHDLKQWGDRAATVKLEPSPKYKGFAVMLGEIRIRQAPKLMLSLDDKDEDILQKAIQLLKMWDDRFAISATKKFFPMRIINDRIREAIVKASEHLGWNIPLEHDSETPVENIDQLMSSPPPTHTGILIKGFWSASKRLIRGHVGGSYDTPTATRNTTKTSQGLTARFCDTYDYDGDDINPDLRPLHFCDVGAVKQYLNWWNTGADYTKAPYTSPRLKSNGKGTVRAKKSKLHETNIIGELTPIEVFGAQIPQIVSISPEQIKRIVKSKTGHQRHEQIKLILKEANPDLFTKLQGYECLKASIPDKTRGKYIDDVIRASKEKRTYFTDDHSLTNSFNCYIDTVENRLCFVIWKGKKAEDASPDVSVIEHVV
jgi:hypothetical protein